MVDQPLKGVKVIDMGAFAAGSSCGRILGDWGADVIKIEVVSGDASRKGGGMLGLPCTESDNIHWELLSANKRCICIDMKNPDSLAVMDRLLKTANIFFTNNRKKALVKLGMDYETLSKRFPHLIYGLIGGYGEMGPMCDDPAFDVIAYWAGTGLLTDTTDTSSSAPTLGLVGTGDLMVGGMMAGGLAACLYQQALTGKGQKVMTSLYATGLWQCACETQSTYRGVDKYPKNRRKATTPFVTTYNTKDGEWFLLAVIEYDKYAPIIFSTVGRPEWINDPEYNTQAAGKRHCEEIVDAINGYFMTLSYDEVDELLVKMNLPHSKMSHFSDNANNPQARANNYVYDFTTRAGTRDIMVSPPIKYGVNDPMPHRNAPYNGEHSVEILQEYGFTEAEIKSLLDSKTVIQYQE